jgi:hypothetical protein
MRDRRTLLFERTADVISEYERGFVGAFIDLSANARLTDQIEDIGGYADGGMACSAAGLDSSGAGKLSLPFLAAMKLYPGVLPGVQQLRGDCVSFSSRTAAMVSYCAALLYGNNTSKFDAPVASPEAIANGLFSTESWFWFRGYDGDGWSCSAAAECGLKTGGLVLRKNYPELGLDLTKYSPQMAGRYGRTPPPGEVRKMTGEHLLQNATVCSTWQSVRDMLANGYALTTCGMEAWGSTRDENGVCRRSSSSWAHAIAAIAADDRDETRKKYGCGLVLLQNSWSEYMTGPRRIMGTSLEIPPGSFWTRWDDMHDRSCIAFGTGKGWAANQLPDWGLVGVV